jgi:hypothetical protein
MSTTESIKCGRAPVNSGQNLYQFHSEEWPYAGPNRAVDIVV